MTRPAADDTGSGTAGPARAKREHLERDARGGFADLGSGRLRVTYADGDVATWQREGATDWYRRIG